MTNDQINFQKDFETLLTKYPDAVFEVNVCPYYGDVEGIEISMRNIRLATKGTSARSKWGFDK